MIALNEYGRPRPWTDIVRAYRSIEASVPVERRASEKLFWSAFSAVGDLASHIADGPLDSVLFGWKSMLDLGIQQTDVNTFSTSHLRVSPQSDGTVEFRYVDTNLKSRQWSRIVPPEGVIGRFEASLDQLHWIARQQRLKSSHCAFSQGMRYGPAMTRNANSAVYYYPDEVGIG